MKKQILTVLAALMLTSTAYAGSIGFGGQLSYANIDASGSETEVGTATKSLSDSEVTKGNASHDGAIIASIYAEYNTDFLERGDGNSFTIGASLVPISAEVSESDLKRSDAAGGDVSTEADAGERSAQAELEDLRVFYAEIPVMGGFYVRGGMAQVDVITTESFSSTQGVTPSNYGNKTIDGYNYGLGYKGILPNGIQYKVSYQQTDFDSFSLTSNSGNKVSADIDTQELVFSAGFRF